MVCTTMGYFFVILKNICMCSQNVLQVPNPIKLVWLMGYRKCCTMQLELQKYLNVAPVICTIEMTES